MKTTTIQLHSQFQIGQVDPRIFGGFLEHMGRAVYEGVYDPNCAHADEDGFRQDTVGALRRLNMSVMRYPGGNFASGYHWQDGVGPRNGRPTVRELAWQSIETNQFGTAEYMELCRQMAWTPMLTVNLGTGTPEEARNWVEYCNSPVGTRFADGRVEHGSPAPYAVPLWCLGNEMDGHWQIGHVPAEQYAMRAQQAASMMKGVDPTIELVACGTSAVTLPSYIEWDRQVLEYMGDLADYISLHRYVGNHNNNTADYLGVTNAIDQQIEEMDAVCRFVQAKRRSSKRAYLCFDEWNVWYKNHEMDGEGKFAPHLIEEVYNLEDALVVAGFLNSFIRHADVVKIANLAQIVNVIAPILTQGDEMLLQSIFYAFEMFSKRQTGVSLRAVVEGPVYESVSYGRLHTIDSSVILDGDHLHLFTTNRSLTETAPILVSFADQAIHSLVNGELLTGADAKAVNSFAEPEQVVTRPFSSANVSNGEAYLEVPPLSFVATTWRIDC